MNFFKDYGLTIAAVAGVMFVIGLYGWLLLTSWTEENNSETIILRDGSQSYACTVSQADSKPHNCKPIYTPLH